MACVYECISVVMGLLSVVAERVGCDGMERESVLVDAVVGAECCEEGWGGVMLSFYCKCFGVVGSFRTFVG